MKRRSPAAPLLLPLVTFGIYTLVWFVKTKNEINLVAHSRIPTAWLLILPIVSIWWEWKLAVGVEEATHSGLGRHGAVWLLFLLGPLGALFVQISLNSTINSSSWRRADVRELLLAQPADVRVRPQQT